MEIILTLAVNSSFSPHLSHSFSFFYFSGLFPSRQPGLGWAGRSCPGACWGAREDAACLKLPEGHHKGTE